MILIDVTATYASVRDGAFHTDYRYLRERSVAGSFGLIAGATAGMHIASATGSTTPLIVWRYLSGSYEVHLLQPPLTISYPTITQTINQVDG